MPEPPRIIAALDFAAADDALRFAGQLDPRRCALKVGHSLYARAGAPLLGRLAADGFRVFLDLNVHDIPSVVAAGCRAAADMGVWMIDVHAASGPRALAAARESLENLEGRRPLLVAVTVLTSLDEAELRILGVERTLSEQVLLLAELARDGGLDGVVCSAREAPALRARCGADFCLVTPGIRTASQPADDQRRAATPAEAVRNGADYLVVGRGLLHAADPAAALERLTDEVERVARAS